MFGKTKTYRCPDGPRIVYKNINDVFPLHLKGVEASTNASGDIVGQVTGKLSGKYKNRLDALFVDISAANASVQQHLRGEYSVYAASPCTAHKNYADAVTDIRHHEQKLRAIELILEKLLLVVGRTDGGGLTDPLVEALITRAFAALELPSTVEVLAAEMAAVPSLTAQWKENGKS